VSQRGKQHRPSYPRGTVHYPTITRKKPVGLCSISNHPSLSINHSPLSHLRSRFSLIGKIRDNSTIIPYRPRFSLCSTIARLLEFGPESPLLYTNKQNPGQSSADLDTVFEQS
jgi:hypothetical protein